MADHEHPGILYAHVDKELPVRIARTLIKISLASGPLGGEDSAGLSINTPLRAPCPLDSDMRSGLMITAPGSPPLRTAQVSSFRGRRRGSNQGPRVPRSSGQAEMASPVRTDASDRNSQGTPRIPPVSGETAHQRATLNRSLAQLLRKLNTILRSWGSFYRFCTGADQLFESIGHTSVIGCGGGRSTPTFIGNVR